MRSSSKADGGSALIQPHGGTLVDLMATQEEARQLLQQSHEWPVWNLTPQQLCDAEMVLNGGFSPLRGFLDERSYNGVCKDMRLPDGTVWPMPITLDVDAEFAAALSEGDRVVLSSPEGVRIAVLTVSGAWTPDRLAEARAVFGTNDEAHPGVAKLLHGTNAAYVGGELRGLELPPHYDFQGLRHTPRELRAVLEGNGNPAVIAFQTRNPMHRAHLELTRRGASQCGGQLLVHPVVGVTKVGDIAPSLRVKCYKAIMPKYEDTPATLSLLPLAMRMAGPREAVWHAIIRKNYGCSHFIVGRDHAGPGAGSDGKPFYGPYDAQEMLAELEDEVGVRMVPFEEMVYLPGRGQYVARSEAGEGEKVASLSGAELRQRLAKGDDIPAWFSYPEVVQKLRLLFPPRRQQGFTLFFTGLPSSGKSTIANIVQAKLLEQDARPITLLDGDVARKSLSSELTFSEEHRNLNIRRLGFVANEVTRNGGAAICAPIAPYSHLRREVRSLIAPNGGFVEIHVDAPVEVCEQRDRKGMYAKARKGIIKGFTGIDAPYERPAKPEIRLDTAALSAEQSADKVLAFLRQEGFID